jgi:dipeptidyl aminopeptidase/acylaminoacyl peptidase
MGGAFVALLAVTMICPRIYAESPPSAPMQGSNELSTQMPTPSQRKWTIQDIVEVARIKGIAVEGSAHRVAFILEQPSIAKGKNDYGLYVVETDIAAAPRKLLTAEYLSDIAWRPGTHDWTVRGDLGAGVQLYAVSMNGTARVLIANPKTVVIGGSGGLQSSPTEAPRETGVLSYEWAPNGMTFWYSTIRIRSPAEQKRRLDQGLLYDDRMMAGATDRDIDRSVMLLGTELHVVDASTGRDRVVAFAPADPGGDFDIFRRNVGSARWVDSEHIQYWLRGTVSGVERYSRQRIDIANDRTVYFPTESAERIYYSTPTKEGFLTVQTTGSNHRLLNFNQNGRVVKDYGPVKFERIGGGRDAWMRGNPPKLILSMEFSDHDGLTVLGPNAEANALIDLRDHLSACSFNSDLSFGACSRENITLAPELIAIIPATGALRILARPNSQYDAIAPLRTVPAVWKNKYSVQSDGYVTYPRDYRPGTLYPALVVTHSWDAKNRFAYGGFQWEFPIQVFAERGYFVLSVNEPQKPQDIPLPGHDGASQVGIATQQFYEGFNPLATMEAAALAAVTNGWVNSTEIGIAGFSRGSTISRFAMSHSKLFTAAASGDATWWDAGDFWEGAEYSRKLYETLFGGSPFDSGAYANYLEFSASARARQFAGPLLQQFTGTAARNAVEMDQLLRHAGVPTELHFFPDEAHLFWQPRHRASAMEQNLDWFDYWLLKMRDEDPEKKEQYDRWDQMAEKWQLRRGRLTSVAGGSAH